MTGNIGWQRILIHYLTRYLANAPAESGGAQCSVQCFETHLSWVIVANGLAYKVKKALRFDFVDFSTLAARRFYCETELRLNRRFAPDLYLSVEAITGSVEEPRIGGNGEAIEYLVKMRAFDQTALWSVRVAKKVLSAAEVDAFARQIACFHETTDRAPLQSGWGSAQTVWKTAEENLGALTKLVRSPQEADIVQKLALWQREQHDCLGRLFDQRREQGFVRQCHGDLHSGNIVTLQDRVAAFDCIEFSEALRWIDVINDLAFISMDLECLGLPGMAARLLDGYLSCTGDYAGLSVLRYYRVERALVRARVGLLQASQVVAGRPAVVPAVAPVTAAGAAIDKADPAQARAFQYLKFSTRAIAQPATAIMIMHGLSGSGKSTFSQCLLELASAVRLRSDVERKRLHAVPAMRRKVVTVGHGMYTAAASEATYARLQVLARQVISAGYPVIIDAAFLRKQQRRAFRLLAAELGVPFFLFDLQASAATLRRRVAAREHVQYESSDADLAVLEHQIGAEEPLARDEGEGVIVFDAEAWFDPAAIKHSCAPVLRALGRFGPC